jgi:hypothetical protein|tara:strand:- start:114 stop:377 length:264 start_codon:yes stop_codon:yes gene_type:complete
MIVCFEKSTGRPLEMQSNSRPGTLISNAVNAGFLKGQVEERDITSSEWETLMAEWDPPRPNPEKAVFEKASINEKISIIARRLRLED